MNSATLEIKGNTGTLTVKLDGKTIAKKVRATERTGKGWGGVMAAANREVERLGVYVQVWNGGTGDGTYRTALGSAPMFLD